MTNSIMTNYRRLLVAAIIGTLAVCLPATQSAPTPDESTSTATPWEFFAFDNGIGRDAGWGPPQQAELLAELGFDGIGYTGITNLEERIAACEARGLRIFSLYVHFHSSKEQSIDPAVIEALPAIKDKQVTLWMTISGQASDEETAERLRALADQVAPFGVRIAIYPHHGNQVATAEHALRIIRLVDRPNAGMAINLCHELRAGNGPRLKQIIRESIDHLSLVSINGANNVDPGELGGSWRQLIRPLGDGDFNVMAILAELRAAGYQGPIGLQCYSIEQPPEQMLKQSISTWNEYCSRLD